MSRRSVSLLIEDLIDAMKKIERYIIDMDWESFQSDEKTSDAVVRNLEVIGEASNRLPLDFKEKNNSIEWFKIVGLRHRIVHDYFGVDLAIIWQIIQRDLPNLKIKLENVLKIL